MKTIAKETIINMFGEKLYAALVLGISLPQAACGVNWIPVALRAKTVGGLVGDGTNP